MIAQIREIPQFQVALFRKIDDPTPFTTIPITAKMPLGALVFALKRLHVTRVAHVVVAWEEEEQANFHYETDFYNVVVGRTNLTYGRMVEVESAPDRTKPLKSDRD